MSQTHTVTTADGRTLVVQDTGALAAPRLTLIWHTGSPQTGALLDPLVAAAADREIRLLSYGRPSYGGSTPQPGRTVAGAAADVAAIAAALDLATFAVMGHSGGGPHALACAALLPGRVTGAVSISGPAPIDAPGLDFVGGMIDPGALQAARSGREERARFDETAEFNPESFLPRDYAALSEQWPSLSADVGRASAAGPDGLIDDDVAMAQPWGVALEAISTPVLLIHGGADRVIPAAHSLWLVERIPDAELWLRPHDGHISILATCALAMDWLLQSARGRR